MKKTIQWLTLLLGIQGVLALVLGLSGTHLAPAHSAGPLLSFDKAAIQQITLEGPDETKVTLVKQADQWQLAEAGDFPADNARVRQLLNRLANLSRGDVVAASRGAHARFSVSDDAFVRRITLATGNNGDIVLYVGTSPGLRQLHVRRKDDDDVHVIPLAVSDIPVNTAYWQDKALLAIPREQIQALALDGLTLTRTPQDDADAPTVWQAEPLPAERQLDADAVTELLRQLAELRIDEVLGTQERPVYGLTTPVLTLTVSLDNGQERVYRLGKSREEGTYTLKASGRPEYFRLSAWTAEKLLDATRRDALLTTTSGTPDTADAPEHGEHP